MKLKFTYTIFSLAFLALVFMSNENGRADSQGWGNTGAPGDQMSGNSPRTCISCHGTSTTIMMTTGIEVMDDTGTPITEYIPGETYRVRVSHNVVGGSPFGYGFQIVSLKAPVDVNGNDVAGFSNPANNVKIAVASNTSRQYAEHNGQSDEPIFEVDWTAPEQGTGPVTFYSCGNAVNDNDLSSGDGAACATPVELAEGTSSSVIETDKGIQIYLYPNPVFEEMKVSLISDFAADFDLEIYDMQGRLVISRQLFFGAGESNFVYNVNQLERGSYLVKFSNNDKIATAKMLKM